MHRTLLLVLTVAPLTAQPAPPRTHPNVLLVLVDDLGWHDLGCQGNPVVRTPRIDAFAAQGLRCTDAYAAAPVCSPTRAAILTGLSPARLRITNHIPDHSSYLPDDAELLPATMHNELAASHETLAERLRAAGYRTGFFGKWHLAGPARRQGRGDATCYPEAQGFESNAGGCAYGGPPTYFDPYRIHNLAPRESGEYLPDRLVDEAVAFVEQHRTEPWFVALWHYTVHWPMEAPEELVARYRGKEGPGVKDARYAAMTDALDSAFGRLLDALERLELADDTLVVFTSDNGGYLGVTDNGPLRQGKGYLYEGGLRVPLLLRWPREIAAGTTSATPVVSTDLFPTVLAACGVAPPADAVCDGVDLAPLWRGEELAERSLCFHYPNYAWHRRNRLGGALRRGRYKLVEHFDDGSAELYDLAADLGEQRDLSAAEPDVTQRLLAELRAWRTDCDAAMPRR